MSASAKPPCKHVVQQGEWLAKIAASYGFKDWQYVWSAAENDALRKRRERAEQLLPGDEVFIPARRAKVESCAAGSAHRFVVDLGETTLKLRLKDGFGEAIANTDYTLDYRSATGPGSVTGTTDGSGQLEATVPILVEAASLSLPGLGRSMELALGHVDPLRDGDAPTRSGVLGRLANLGYGAGPDADDEQACLAISTFQREKLGRSADAASGELDDETCDAILSEHGC